MFDIRFPLFISLVAAAVSKGRKPSELHLLFHYALFGSKSKVRLGAWRLCVNADHITLSPVHRL